MPGLGALHHAASYTRLDHPPPPLPRLLHPSSHTAWCRRLWWSLGNTGAALSPPRRTSSAASYTRLNHPPHSIRRVASAASYTREAVRLLHPRSSPFATLPPPPTTPALRRSSLDHLAQSTVWSPAMEPNGQHGQHGHEDLVDFFSQSNSMAPSANPADMEFFSESSAVGHGRPLRHRYSDIDLNSQASEFPHLSSYQEILQSPGAGAEVVGGHRGIGGHRGVNSSRGGRSNRTPSARDAATNAVASFRAPRTARQSTRGGRGASVSAGAAARSAAPTRVATADDGTGTPRVSTGVANSEALEDGDEALGHEPSVSDVVPMACRVAADVGIRSVCIGNFSWDFIYAEYIMGAGHHHRSIVWQIAEDYSHCDVLLRLPGYCPMPAFRDVIDVPLVVRGLRKSRAEVRKELGIEENAKVLVFNFGGQPAGWKLKQEWLPDGWICLACGASDSQDVPPNFIKLAKDAYTPDVMAASDCMLGKIGYGTASEALAYKLPFVFVRRDYFNEEPFLRNLLEHYQGSIEMIRRDFLSGHWKPYLLRALTLQPCYNGPINGGEVVAQILQDTAIGKKCVSDKFSGARRLQDAIVLGYQLQRASGRDVGIPDWYSPSKAETGAGPTSKSVETKESAESCFEDFEILHGDLQGLTDTMAFLKSLSGLNGNDLKSPEKQPRERTAASVLFDWEKEIYIARAPGRLDVMGGIADYSGSLVLQMPLQEACHVAVQRNHPSKQKLWKHTQARQLKKAGLVPVIQIVSFGSELSNRAPTFDMDMSDLMDGEKPISYDKAREFFCRDSSQKWAAYVTGTILVLMIELGVQFTDSMSILVSSVVPEGKGVSSSASVEVATMSAIASAYGLNITPRDLALLCQKVENHVVGAPCGVMDQMTSACGEANKLLAMVCQPAEVKELVSIPTHMRFWGLDSGIRHSVGGGDYGSVRVGTYMGRKMIKCAASDLVSESLTSEAPVQSDCYKENGTDLLKSEAALEYLCNLPPHRYEAVYAKDIPEVITGDAFLEKYGDHNDTVTKIDPKRSYSVKAPTRHPIYENFRVETFKALLAAGDTDEQLSALGELMYQCHYSYSACGLGSDGTDRLVNLVQEMQHRKTSDDGRPSLFGAKITGGGSDGSICVIGKNCARSCEEIDEIQQRYKAATGYLPIVFDGSSPGAGKFGYLKIRRRHPL